MKGRMKMTAKWEDNIRRVEPYVPGEQPAVTPGMIKLNTNENPYPPSPSVVDAISAFDYEKLRLYPNTNAAKLVTALSEYYKVDESKIFVGVGSDDVLAMCFMTFFNSDKPILFPDITYSFYDVWAKLFGIPYEQPSLDENFRLVKEDYYKDNGGIVIANPNAPTGVCEDIDFIEDILQHNQDSIVIVDEAYVDFGGVSALSLIDKYDNLVVVQTFSKSRSMAGMRIGFCFANEKLINALKTVKFSYNSYTMNLAAIEIGAAAVADREYFEERVNMIIGTRERTKEELRKLGFTFPDSKSNFIFAKHESAAAEDIMEALREKEIYVRHFNSDRIKDYLRITIGTDEQMEKMLTILKEYLGK